MSHCDRPQDGCTCRLIPTICLSSITIRWARLFRYAYVRARCPMSNLLHVHVETVAHHVYLVSSSGPPSPPDGAPSNGHPTSSVAVLSPRATVAGAVAAAPWQRRPLNQIR